MGESLYKMLLGLILLSGFAFAENENFKNDTYIFFAEIRASKNVDAGVALHSIEFDNKKSCKIAVAKFLTLNNSSGMWNNGIRNAFCFKRNIK